MTTTLGTGSPTDTLLMIERARRLARQLGPGWTACEGHQPELDHSARLEGPNGEVLALLRKRHFVADPTQWRRIEIRGLVPRNIPATTRTRLPRPISVQETTSAASAAHFVIRWLLPRYTQWLDSVRQRDDRPVLAGTCGESLPTRVQQWCAARDISYTQGHDDDDRLVLIVGGEPMTPSEAERRILAPAEDPEAYAAFAALADRNGPERARRDVEMVGITFGAVAVEWEQRWHLEHPAEIAAVTPQDSSVLSGPALQNSCGARGGYRDWPHEHGRGWDYFDADPVEGTCRVVVLGGWSLAVEPMHALDGVCVRLTKPRERCEAVNEHDLSRTSHDSVYQAHKALFAAGVIAVRVYEDQMVRVQAWSRVGRGYGHRDRVRVLDWKVPPAADRRTILDEVYAITVASAARPRIRDAISAEAMRYQHQGYPQLTVGDLVDLDGHTYELTAEGGWRQVTQVDLVRGRQPRTVHAEVPGGVDGRVLTAGHYIEATAKVYLKWGRDGWEVDTTSTDGHALDLVGEDGREDNSECAARKDDGDECAPTATALPSATCTRPTARRAAPSWCR